MRVLWITARDFSKDLAKSTEIGISDSLSERGHQVTIISPGVLSQGDIAHHRIAKFRFPGLNTISGARNIRKLLKTKNEEFAQTDLVMVDWRYVLSLRAFLKTIGTPWFIIDRGPPADLGILKFLQKRFWRRAWEIADKFASGGFTVSKEHTEFVRERNRVKLRIFEIPAGSERNKYLEEKTDPKDCLRLVYSGRLDKRRGIQEIFRLTELLELSGIKFRIDICGKGDLSEKLEKYGEGKEYFTFHGMLQNDSISKILAGCHVGIMPMPNITVWRISSPLKLAEYLAAGLMIVGPKHPGNNINEESDAIRLSDSDPWPEYAINEIKNEINRGWKGVEEDSLEAAKTLDWGKIVSDLEEEIRRWEL